MTIPFEVNRKFDAGAPFSTVANVVRYRVESELGHDPSIEAICAWTEAEWLRVPNFGRKCLAELRAWVTANGGKLGFPTQSAALHDLTDPMVVHINMLRGTIAMPTPKQIVHLYGAAALLREINAPEETK